MLVGDDSGEQVEHADAQLYLYQGFLSKADCKTLIKKIDADAVPSTLYKGTEQAGFRTSYSCRCRRKRSGSANKTRPARRG